MRTKQKDNKRKSLQKIQQAGLHRKIVAPQKLKILVLSGNDLFNEHLDFLGKCINLIKLDLSHNNITKISQKIDFKPLFRLEAIQLHNNKFNNIQGFRSILNAKNVSYLTFHHNPISNPVRVEHQIVNSLPSLKLLNDRVVFIEERSNELFAVRKQVFADVDVLEFWKSTQNSQAYYLKVLSLQLQYIDNIWAFNNPIVIIQRAWRHFFPQNTISSVSDKGKKTNRSKLSNYQKQTIVVSSLSHPLRQWFKEWKRFTDSISEVKKLFKEKIQKGKKHHMVLPLDYYLQELRNKRLQDPLKRFLAKIRRKVYEKKMVDKFRSVINLKRSLFDTLQGNFYSVAGIAQTKRIFYNKSQQHILDNFLKYIAQKFKKRQVIYNQCKCQQSRTYSAIRLIDPDTLSNKFRSKTNVLSMCCLIWPSMKAVVIGRRKNPTKFEQGIIGIRQLTYIRNRDKILTLAQVQKSKQVYKRLEKFAEYEYQMSMCSFQCQDQFVMRHLIRMIYYHNAKALQFEYPNKSNEMLSLIQNYQQPFVFYIDKILIRTKSAVIIQKTWRRYISNKNQPQSIYFKMKKNRAALHIQKFVRNMIYNHRNYFNKKLYYELSQNSSATLIYPLEFYMNLKLIQSQNISLFKNIRLTRKQNSVGLTEQFNRPLFQKIIRDKFLDKRNIGLEFFDTKIDLYNVFHYNSEIKLLTRNQKQFVSITFQSINDANICSSIIALFTYELWGKRCVFPLYKEKQQKWERKLKDQTQIKKIQNILGPTYFERYSGQIKSKEIKHEEYFIWTDENIFKKRPLKGYVIVDFYQKKFHNFPAKYIQKFNFSYSQSDKATQTKDYTEDLKLSNDYKKIQAQLDGRTAPLIRSKEIGGPLTINTIDQKKISVYDQSQRSLKISQEKPNEMNKTMYLTSKRQKVIETYKEEIMKRQAQKQVKKSSISAIRDRVKQQRQLNTTLKSLKQIERTEEIKSKVQKVKQFKRRASSKKQQDQFIQQNNFVMQQQLKMVIMRGRIKESEQRKQQIRSKRVSIDKTRQESQVNTPTVISRRSSRHKLKKQQELIPIMNESEVLGEQGSIINTRTKRNTKKARSHSIGAYLRDPSFVHGVFPQEYYPIETNGSQFRFPPV